MKEKQQITVRNGAEYIRLKKNTSASKQKRNYYNRNMQRMQIGVEGMLKT